MEGTDEADAPVRRSAFRPPERLQSGAEPLLTPQSSQQRRDSRGSLASDTASRVSEATGPAAGHGTYGTLATYSAARRTNASPPSERRPLLAHSRVTQNEAHAANAARGYYQAEGAEVPAPKPVASDRPRPTLLESSTYNEPDSAVFDAAQSGKTRWHYRKRTITRWLFNFLIAVFVALVAVLITFATHQLTSWRFDILTTLINLERDGLSGFGTALSGFTAISIAYALISSGCTAYLAPAAAGSGISEIKSVLNGIQLPSVLSVKTLAVKVFGLIFAVSSGLPVGREGPMIHTGAIAAAGLTQGQSNALGCNTRWSLYSEFRNDKEKRDFVACGAAAGVAAAFGAPIGGVLFAIEEGATHWHRALVWRTFFCAIVTAWINQVFLSGLDGNWGQMTSSGMFNFGTFATDSNITWQAWELPFFISIGAIGGLIGVGFSGLQTIITKFRLRFVPVTAPFRRVLEVCLVIALKITVEFLLAVLFASCQPRPSPATASDASYTNDLQSFYCEANSYNEMASLWMVPSEDAIKQLFHFSNPFSLTGLAAFCGGYLGLMCLTYGVSVPSGVFIPALLSGSALGRLIGELLRQYLPNASVNAGVYSLVGAAAVLGGVTRMTISLAVIILETTGNYEFALPITATLLAARFVGNWFNQGIYDLHIHLRKWPLLPDALPTVLGKELRVCDVMAKPPVVLREVEAVGAVYDVLSNTTHNAFPVVYGEDLLRSHPRIGSLAGIISRRELSVLILHRAFHPSLPTMPFQSVLANSTAATRAAFTISTAGVHLPSDPHLPSAGLREDAGVHSDDLDEITAANEVPDVSVPMQASRRPSFRRAQQRQEVAPPPRSFFSALRGRAPSLPEVRIRLPAVSTTLNEPVWTAAQAASTAFDAEVMSGAPQDAAYKITIADPTAGSEKLQFVAEADVLELLYTDEPLLQYSDFTACYPTYPQVTGMRLSENQRRMFMDLRPYQNPTPYTIHVHAPMTRAFELFRSLALHHLVVVNDSHDVVGILTRHEFLFEHLTACAAHKRRKIANRQSIDLEHAPEVDEMYDIHED